MPQTAYQRKLSVAAFDARVHDHLKAAGTLNKMIVAAENGRYVDLHAFHAMLPPTYRTMVGPPPQSRSKRRHERCPQCPGNPVRACGVRRRWEAHARLG